MRVTKIQDDGNKFIIHGDSGLYSSLEDVFDQIGLGISVTKSDRGVANIIYTENNRDIVLSMLKDHTRGKMKNS